MSINNAPAPFDKIAAGWYNYRHHTIFKTELTDLARRWKCGRLLNLGCGHGADFLPFKDGFELHGLDISSEMLKYAHKFADKHGLIVNLKQGDMRALPYPDAYFDFSIAVASLHHIKGKADQRQALLELYRVLKPGAEAFITIWNARQPRFWLKHRDTFIPWQSGDEVIQRFYHLFTFGEIENLVRSCGFSILSSKAESRFTFPIKDFSRNICLLIKKPV
jgi:ubiquinone/menaquinone biosynthesis C-methylase UbiE